MALHYAPSVFTHYESRVRPNGRLRPVPSSQRIGFVSFSLVILLSNDRRERRLLVCRACPSTGSCAASAIWRLVDWDSSIVKDENNFSFSRSAALLCPIAGQSGECLFNMECRCTYWALSHPGRRAKKCRAANPPIYCWTGTCRRPFMQSWSSGSWDCPRIHNGIKGRWVALRRSKNRLLLIPETRRTPNKLIPSIPSDNSKKKKKKKKIK